MLFPLSAEQESDEKGIVPDDMTNKEVDSISNTQSDISEVEGGYWSADRQLYLGPMTRSRTKIKMLAKAKALVEEHFSTGKDVNVDISTFQFETSASVVKVTVECCHCLLVVSLTVRKWFK